MIVTVSPLITATMGLAIFVLGTMLNKRITLLRDFNIPDSVSGGLVAAFIAFLIYFLAGIELSFELQARDFFLVLFFAGIGLNAKFSDLITGGKPLLILLVLTIVMIVIQNVVGAGGAMLFGYAPSAGVLFGSAALIGGHGTAIAWSPAVVQSAGLPNAEELGIAVATLGLVIAALIGGPIARFLVEGRNLSPEHPDAGPIIGIADSAENEDKSISPVTVSRVLLYLNLAIIAGLLIHDILLDIGVNLPLFVPCLIMGIVLANLRSFLFPSAEPVARTHALALISEISLGAFLSMSLMALQLWTLVELGAAIASILALQTAVTLCFVIFVLFPLMGGNYRAAVLGAGFAGFSLGATPTAIANMTAVTKRYGPSPMAFVILPLVSAFFVDIANIVAIKFFIGF